MVQASLSESFLKGQDIIDSKISELKLLDEGAYVQGNYGEQLQLRVKANDEDERKFKWSLTAQANDELIKLFGKDTADWVGRTIKVSTKLNKNNNPTPIVVEEVKGSMPQ